MTTVEYCPVILTPGFVSLGGVAIYQDGYCTVGLQIGWPGVRDVVRPVALGDGTFDDTQYFGSRAITVTLRLDQRYAKTQTLLDQILPQMRPNLANQLMWQLAGDGSPGDIRSARVRGVDAPVVVNGPKYLTIVLSFVSTGTPYLFGDSECEVLIPTDAPADTGRTYDLTFDRVYSSISPPNTFQITNVGNAPTDWYFTLNGPAVDPIVSINGVDIRFDENGGLVLPSGAPLEMITETRSVRVSGVSVFDRVNFEDWSWSDVLLQPGVNTISLSGTGFDVDTLFTFCWAPYWY